MSLDLTRGLERKTFGWSWGVMCLDGHDMKDLVVALYIFASLLGIENLFVLGAISKRDPHVL